MILFRMVNLIFNYFEFNFNAISEVMVKLGGYFQVKFSALVFLSWWVMTPRDTARYSVGDCVVL